MMSLDLVNLSEKQIGIVQEIWKVCEYFEVSRNWGIEGAILAQQGRHITSLMRRYRREEDKKSGKTGKAG